MFKTENSRHEILEFDLLNHHYVGQSVGSMFTCHQFPHYGICFDLGRAFISSTYIDNVFITHGHMDHIGDVVNHLYRRRGWGMPDSTYYIPSTYHADISEMVRLSIQMSKSSMEFKPEQFVSVETGDEFLLSKGNNLNVKAFTSTHRIPCLGYAVMSNVKKLNPEYASLTKNELIALRKTGVDVNHIVERVEIAYPGDTSLAILNKPAGDIVRKARVLLLECSFIDDEVTIDKANRTGHVHLDDFIQKAREGAFENELILLTHFSARYTTEYIKKTLCEKLANEDIIQRVKLLLA